MSFATIIFKNLRQRPARTALTVAGIATGMAVVVAFASVARGPIRAIALGGSVLGVATTVLMSLFERTHEIGILLAVGWRRSRIIAMVFLESVSLGLVGGIVGTPFGVAVVKLLQGDFSPGLFGLALLVSVGVGLLGGLHAAIRTSRLNPADALRHE